MSEGSRHTGDRPEWAKDAVFYQIFPDRFARSVVLEGDADGDAFGWFFEDNWFDLLPGETKVVRVLGRHKQGRITAEEAHEHPHRHVLYRCLGLKPGIEIDIYPSEALHPGDALLLCSDGLWDMVYPRERLATFLTSEAGPLTICRRLVDAANEAGGEDNITAVLVRVEERHA